MLRSTQTIADATAGFIVTVLDARNWILVESVRYDNYTSAPLPLHMRDRAPDADHTFVRRLRILSAILHVPRRHAGLLQRRSLQKIHDTEARLHQRVQPHAARPARIRSSARRSPRGYRGHLRRGTAGGGLFTIRDDAGACGAFSSGVAHSQLFIADLISCVP